LPDIQREREFLLTAVKTHSPQFFQQLSPALQNEEEVVMAYVSGIENSDSSKKKLRDVPVQFKSNPRVVLAAVAKLSNSVQDANPVLLDKEFAINCVRANFNALQYLPAFQDDNDVVLQAISIDGRAIRHASDRIKRDRTVGMHAVRQTGRALYYLDESLKNNEEIVRVAIETFPEAIIHTSEKFQNDNRALVRRAIMLDYNVLRYLPIYKEDIAMLQLIPPERRTEEQKSILREKESVAKAMRKVGYHPIVSHKIQHMLGTNRPMGGTRKKKRKNNKNNKNNKKK
jgi:hypothetical protein